MEHVRKYHRRMLYKPQFGTILTLPLKSYYFKPNFFFLKSNKDLKYLLYKIQQKKKQTETIYIFLKKNLNSYNVLKHCLNIYFYAYIKNISIKKILFSV